MLDYIRKQLQSKAGLEEEPVQEAQMDEAILECAHLFQEMEDLTMNGKASARSFNRMSIPLEDDIEITSLELNMLDGRATNIPGDATVQEQAEVEPEPYKYGDYTKMKTRSDFYQEAYGSLTQFPRETDDEFAKRVEAKASKLFREYREYIIQEGLFGNDMIKVTDGRVPPRIIIDFGECEGKPYYVKMPVLFQVDNKDRITKKQLDTAYILRDWDALGVKLREVAYKIWGEKVSCDSIDKIWKFVTPTKILIPRDPVDKYFAYFEFELDGESKPDYISIAIPTSHSVKDVKNIENISKDAISRVTDKKGITGAKMVSKMDGIRMEEALMKKPKASRFFQEEIDFGDPNTAPDADPNATSVSVDTAPSATPSIDGGAPAADGAPADGLDATAAPADTTADNKEVVATNDVSGDIAEKISDETNADSDINTDDVNLDATNASDVSDDLGTSTDEPSEEDLQADLGADTSSDVDTSSTEMSDMDFDNMTVDELLAQGTDKLKGMTIQQLKDFLGSPDGTSPTDVGEGVQEAFFLTRGNIGKELDIHLRKALGILNDNEMEIEDLCTAFRKEGKECNRVVHKASKMKKVFNEAEIKQLLRLNHCLSDLMAMMRADVKKSELMTVKRMIQAFVSEATAVLKMLETREKPTDDGEPVQEGFFDGLRKKSSDSRIAKIEAKSGPLPDDLKKYLSTEKGMIKWNNENHGFYCKMIKDQGKYHIINQQWYPSDIARAKRLDIVVPLFGCYNKEIIGYSVKDKTYCIFDWSGENVILKIADSFAKLKDALKDPAPDDTDYIEAATGKKLPERFKKIFKSKMYQEMINCEIEVPKLDSDYDTLFVLYDIFGIVMVSDIDDGEMAEYLGLDVEDVVPFGMVEYDVDLIYVNGKVHSYSTRPEDELDAKRYPDFETFIKVLHETWEKAQPKKSELTNKIGQKFLDKVQKEAPSFVQEAASESSSLKLPEDYLEFLRSGDYKKYKDVRVADECDTIVIHKFFSEKEIQTETEKLSGLKVESPYDGKPHEMIPIASASCEGSKHDYVVIIDYHGKSRYCSLCMKTAEGVPALFMLAYDLKFLKSLIDNPLK